MLYKFLLTARPWQKYTIKAVICISVCVAALVFFLCTAAFMITNIDTPDYVLIPLTTVLITVSSFLASYILSKIFKEKKRSILVDMW